MSLSRVDPLRRPYLAIVALSLFAVAQSPAYAQRGSFSRDPREYIRGKDANGNGILEPNELTGRARDVLERSGQDVSKPIPVDTAIQLFEKASQEGGFGGGGRGGPPGGPGGGFPGGGFPGGGFQGGGFPGGGYQGGGFPGGGFPGGGFPGRGPWGGGPPSGSSPSTPPGDNRGTSSSRTDSKPTVPGFSDSTKIAKPLGFNDAGSAGISSVGLDLRYDRRVIEYAERLFRECDKNQDDGLDESEARIAGPQIEFKESDVNKDGKLTKAELCERISQRWTAASGGPAVVAARGAGRGSSTGATSGSSGSSDEAQKVRRYAESLLRQYDENKNGVLERDEWAQARSINREADTNGDGTITLDELTAKLSNFGREGSGGGSSSGPSGSGRSERGGSGGYAGGPGRGERGGSSDGGYRSYRDGGSSSGGRSANSDKKSSYRQRSPLERLPKGLPDWFARNDANEDGQVTMSEFSTAWNDAKASEFASYDLNNDGVVTAVECIKASEKPRPVEKSTRSERGGATGPGASGAPRGGSFADGGGRDRGGFRNGFGRFGGARDEGGASRESRFRDFGSRGDSGRSAKPADAKPADAKPADEKPVDEKPADEKPADEKAADEKSSEEKPAEEAPADGTPPEAKPEEPNTGATVPVEVELDDLTSAE